MLTSGYHGWHDWNVNLDFDNYSVIEIEYGDLVTLERMMQSHYDSIACFILEPMSRVCPDLASTSYLKKVRELCSEYNVILIFDEILMGCRYAIGGGGEYYGVVPDLACFGKAMSNGYPISALVGKRE